MVLGLKYGHYQSDNNEQKTYAYDIAKEYTKRFKECNGSIVCRDLLGYDLTNPEDVVFINQGFAVFVYKNNNKGAFSHG